MLITKNWCKRFLALACALVCVLALSVQSFAAVNVTNYTVSQLPENARNFLEAVTDNGIYQVNVCLDDQPDNVKDAWKTVMGSWLNNPDYYVFFSFTSLVFKVTAGPKSSFFSKSGSPGLFLSDGYCFYFDISGNNFRKLSLFQEVSSSVALLSGDYFYRSANALFSDSKFSSVSGSYRIISDIDTLIINDDITPDEPDSSVPEVPVDPPKEPEVPAGNPEYVVYNTGLWLTFFRWVRRHIGNAVFVGFIVLAAVMGIYLIFFFFLHYSRQ